MAIDRRPRGGTYHRRSLESAPAAPERRRLLPTRPKNRVELGALIRARIDEYGLHIATVARDIGWTPSRLDTLLRGISISPEVRAWVLLSQRVGLGPYYLLGVAWDIAPESFHLRLPEGGDPRRDEFLRLLVEQDAGDISLV
jgi:hypothetical protein